MNKEAIASLLLCERKKKRRRGKDAKGDVLLQKGIAAAGEWTHELHTYIKCTAVIKRNTPSLRGENDLSPPQYWLRQQYENCNLPPLVRW